MKTHPEVFLAQNVLSSSSCKRCKTMFSDETQDCGLVASHVGYGYVNNAGAACGHFFTSVQLLIFPASFVQLKSDKYQKNRLSSLRLRTISADGALLHRAISPLTKPSN